MNLGLFFKLGAIGLLILLLLIPLLRIDGLITERQRLRDQVVQDIARSSSHAQQIIGPVVVVPYRRMIREWKENPDTQQRYIVERQVRGQLAFAPEVLEVDGALQTELRSRGIYQARLYHAASHLSGHFELPTQFGISEDLASYDFEQPILSIGVSDIRGIENVPSLRLNDEVLKFEPGSGTRLLSAGLHARLPRIDTSAATQLAFAFDLKLQGTSALSLTPMGRETQIALRSDWPHPSFVGEYLPTARTVSAKGFTARWQTSFFSTNIEEALRQCATDLRCEAFTGRHLGVSFVDPVDQYLKSERAIKYALLFIVLTFAGFFLFEVLKRLSVHPIQYGLVGLALALFYLLLLSFAEHIAFGWAYLLSSAACVLLIGFYVSHVLKSLARGLTFAGTLAALYGLLYGLLSAEDYALLMGSLLLFGLLSIMMVLTRKVDWSSIGRRQALP